MSGGLMQLVAYGAQDVYLTGDPQITFWKGVYRRHTHFAIESIENTFNGAAAAGASTSVTISRNADLLSAIHLEVTGTVAGVQNDGSNSANTLTGVGTTLINEVSIQIGGQTIDKQYGTWMAAWDELTLPEEKVTGFNEMSGASITGNITVDGSLGTIVLNAAGTGYVADEVVTITGGGADATLKVLTVGGSGEIATFELTAAGTGYTTADAAASTASLSGADATFDITEAAGSTVDKAFTLHIPLKFWFCRHPGSAIPLVALQFHEVKLNFQFAPAADISNWTTSTIKLYADYVYLDEEERQRFSQSAQEYLIEQVQTRDISLGDAQDISFNHPVKELIWVTTAAMADGAKITFNGQDRAAARPASYYSHLQPYQHHTRIPDATKLTYCYSFGLRPEEHQPSGTVNFSRIDNAAITLPGTAGETARVYAVNYNVLRVQSGLGGLAYSN